jgi:endonuclease G, mitochondrial
MPKKHPKMISATLIVAVGVCVAVGVTSAKHASVTSPTEPPVQESVSLHLTLGNPSGATTRPRDKDNFLLVKPQFALSYNDERGAPNWVSWHLQKSDVGTAARRNDFHPEPNLPDGFKRVRPSDYDRTGFDRGHMCNSEDRTETQEDNTVTFSMANMQPQTPDLNRGVWLRLEAYSRTLLKQGNELYITAGCYGDKKTIGRANKVTVPERCWKVVVVLKAGRNDLSRVDADTRVIAVDMPNRAGVRRDPWQKYIVTVRDVEEKTGYDFLSEVPKRVQDVIETKRDPGRATRTR